MMMKPAVSIPPSSQVNNTQCFMSSLLVLHQQEEQTWEKGHEQPAVKFLQPSRLALKMSRCLFVTFLADIFNLPMDWYGSF